MLVCTICSSLIIPNDDVWNTPCGHIFHFDCLKRWLERSKSCPQCRERTTLETIRKIYLNFSNNDSDGQSIGRAVSLQDEINSLTLRLIEKEKALKNFEELTSDLKSQVTKSEEKVSYMEDKMKSNNSTVEAYKIQLQYLKFKVKDAEKKDIELESIKRENKKMKNVKTLLDASAHEIDEFLESSCDQDPTMLAVYAVVLKKELHRNFSKMRKLRDQIKYLHNEVTKVTLQRDSLSAEQTKRKELEEALANQESEKVYLQTKLLDIHIAAYNCTCGAVSKEKRECPKECKQHDIKEKSEIENETKDECVTNLDKTREIEGTDNSTPHGCPFIINKNNEESTPQNIKSQGFFIMANREINSRGSSGAKKIPSILAKKRTHSQMNHKIVKSDMAFDGFGGHGKCTT